LREIINNGVFKSIEAGELFGEIIDKVPIELSDSFRVRVRFLLSIVHDTCSSEIDIP
jgi:hypothetical protein